jgi:cytochrome P450
MADGSDFIVRPRVPSRHTKPLKLLPYLWKSFQDPLTVFSERHFTEPVIYVRGKVTAVMNVADPAAVRHVLLDNAKNYDKGDFQRRILGPLFTPAKLSTIAEDMRRVCEQRVAAWTPGVMEVEPEMTGITFDIISETMFSNMLGGEAADFERAFNGFVEIAGRLDPFDLLGVPLWIPRFTKLAGGQYGAFFERRVKALVVERQAMVDRGQAPEDLLTALLRARDSEGGGKLSEREVSANILTLILAGHETTARALGWTLHLLSRTPWYQEKIRAEAQAFDLSDPDWQDRMPWTRAVFDEAMRLYPPAPTFLRVPVKDDVIAGFEVPAGSMIAISPYIVHRHRRLWDDPEAFRPERFLPGAREKIDRFAYLPFGGGPRICIGAAFAIQEALIALAVMLRDWEAQPADLAEPIPTHRITLRSRGGIRLRMVKRS